MLSFSDINQLSVSMRGINKSDITFELVSIFSDIPQPKGLFIPINDKNLDRAIENGAIAAIWKENEPLPSYTPNHFPVFFVNRPIATFLALCEDYNGKTNQKECETMTKFAFYSPSLLNGSNYTYDIAVEDERLKVIETIKKYLDKSRKG
ncbi:hypothetical protein [Heyndrickxia vini]|uniref:Uncharacterized protein n=1 Tax=Heyndrickxia vini TaxID=1476025 RepID=A0ABX7DX18_9BACI|nr:hypothetical protein [Heyndrickxia vini]QQZ08034.1 hypothetical protein I5776_13195 [Heyndrickxia vini]